MNIGNNHARTISEDFHNAVARDVRVGYVLSHFLSNYKISACPTISVGNRYPEAPIQIADNAADFFDRQAPYPPEPVWQTWQDRNLPFFFGPAPGKPLMELLPGGRAVIHADLISAAFFLLSGWQEYFSQERDRHGRFPFLASVQHRYKFVAVPVVNYYFDILKTAVEHVLGEKIALRHWPSEAPFSVFLTHDIDNLRSAWKQPAKEALRAGKLLDFGRHLWRHFTKPDAWDNLTQVQATVASYDAKSTFFFLPKNTPGANSTPNADYYIREKAVEQQIKALHEAGSEIAVHGSIGTSGDSPSLVIDTACILEILKQSFASGIPMGNRFHYLSWEPRQTPALLDSVGFSYDTTLGFAEHYGFRNSYCRPFYLYNFAQGGAHEFLEIPLNVMDATLYHPNYLQLAPDDLLPALQPMFEEIERFGGVCTVLWHNENFDPSNEHNGPREFHRIMEYLRSRGAAFVTGRDICAGLGWRVRQASVNSSY